jgi:hypothetical protein
MTMKQQLRAKVVGYNCQKDDGYVASLTCQILGDKTKEGILFKVTHKSTLKIPINTIIVVKYDGYTKHGLPKFPKRVDAPCTKTEWIPGEQVQVPSTTDVAKTYTITMSKNGDCVYCSCLAWKYQHKCPRLRTCKHTIALCGQPFLDALMKPFLKD